VEQAAGRQDKTALFGARDQHATGAAVYDAYQFRFEGVGWRFAAGNRSKPLYDFSTLEKQKAHTEVQAFELYGAPGEIRTPDRLVRSVPA